MSSLRRILITSVPLIALVPLTVAAQSSMAVSPFVSMVPSSEANPNAGMALTFGGTTGLALRGSADMSIANPNKLKSASDTASRYRPWAADADAVLFLGGLGGGATVFSRSLSPYVFSGLGLTGGDSVGKYVVRNGWSYGAGATIPLGLDADLFGEARWRMSQYVLPTSHGAPASKSEFRFGLSFHIGGSREPAPERRRGRRASRDDDEEVVVVAAPPAPAPATATATAINVVVPGGIAGGSSEPVARRPMRYGTGVSVARVISTVERRASGITLRRRDTAVRTSSTVQASSRTTSTVSASRTEARAREKASSRRRRS